MKYVPTKFRGRRIEPCGYAPTGRAQLLGGEQSSHSIALEGGHAAAN